MKKTLKEKIEGGMDVLFILTKNLNVSEDYMIDQYLTIKDLIRQEPNPLMKRYYYFRVNRVYKPK